MYEIKGVYTDVMTGGEANAKTRARLAHRDALIKAQQQKQQKKANINEGQKEITNNFLRSAIMGAILR